jgi:hypothetical protein
MLGIKASLEERYPGKHGSGDDLEIWDLGFE